MVKSPAITPFSNEVILKFESQQAHYIKTLPIHSSQEILEDTAEYTVVKMFVVINTELVMKFMMTTFHFGKTLKYQQLI